MDTQQAYNNWAATYDTVPNKTRDLEALAARQVLAGADFGQVLEIGCGTGKNTAWLAGQAGTLTAVDFSADMLQVARQKVTAPNVAFRQADLMQPWTFGPATLIVCSLVLEHIEDLGFIFEQAAQRLLPGGRFYICELHPYRQLQGSRARFELGDQLVRLEYFVHHISDFHAAAAQHGLRSIDLQEWFDEGDRSGMPRLVSFVFEK